VAVYTRSKPHNLARDLKSTHQTVPTMTLTNTHSVSVTIHSGLGQCQTKHFYRWVLYSPLESIM